MGDAAKRGRWLVFFSHPADFTPVCTSEFIAFAKAHASFQALECDLLALSVDSLFAHVAWVRSIAESFGVEIPFPVAEDPSMAIAAAYGMIGPGARDSATVRATFVIDPDGIIRAQTWYPMTTGRSVAEILRLVEALRVADAGPCRRRKDGAPATTSSTCPTSTCAPPTGPARPARLGFAILPRVIPLLRLILVKNIHTPKESGSALARLIIDPALAATNGKYFEGMREIPSSVDSYDEGRAQELWRDSAILTGLT